MYFFKVNCILKKMTIKSIKDSPIYVFLGIISNLTASIILLMKYILISSDKSYIKNY